MRTGNPGNRSTFSYLGLHHYFLTFCTDQRQSLFTKAPAVTLVLSQISRAAKEDQFAVLAYCFMPDHLHLLVEGLADTSDCRRYIARAKQYSGFHYSKAFRHMLWQRYGFERVLRTEDNTLAVARYIVENPVRARLVLRVEDYPFSGSLVYSLEELIAGIGWSG